MNVLSAFTNRKGKSSNGWIIIAVVLAAFFIVPKLHTSLFSIDFNDSAFQGNLFITLPDNNRVQVSTLQNVQINNNVVVVASDWKPIQTSQAKLVLLQSLDGISKVTIAQQVKLLAGTDNFPSNALWQLSIDRAGSPVKNIIAEDGRIHRDLTLGTNIGYSFSDIEVNVSPDLRTPDYSLVVRIGALAQTDSKAEIKHTLNGLSCFDENNQSRSCILNNVACKAGEVKLQDGSCKKLIRTCIDNNLNNICDPDDPIVYQDPDSSAPVCADRDADRVCDDVASLFCKDENNNRLCDSDEVKWYATNCPDTNGNGICDGIESGKILCPATYTPVCDEKYNITYPNSCFAGGFNATTTEGACKVPPVIIRLDCTTGATPIPSGYLCQPETGFLYRIDKIYQNVTIDCRNLPATEGYTCQQIGDKWVFTKTEVKNIDCYSRGCPGETLCQGGLCVQNPQKCPTQVNCAQKYGLDAACDEETGLCIKQQYFKQDCTVLGCSAESKCARQVDGTNVCVKTELINVTTVIDKNVVFGKPRPISTTALVILGVVVVGAIALAARKKQ